MKFDQEKFGKHLKEKWKDLLCPLCGGKNWDVSPTIYEFSEYNDGKKPLGCGIVMPFIPVVCINCGNTVIISAFSSGAIEQTKK